LSSLHSKFLVYLRLRIFLTLYPRFEREYPDFVKFKTFGATTVICLQTGFMREQMVKDDILDEPVNGLVNDAAHGWWAIRNNLLMSSSSYSPNLACWVPGLFSYTNGASGEHFYYHFLTLFETIAFEAESRGIVVCDRLFAGVSLFFFLSW